MMEENVHRKKKRWHDTLQTGVEQQLKRFRLQTVSSISAKKKKLKIEIRQLKCQRVNSRALAGPSAESASDIQWLW